MIILAVCFSDSVLIGHDNIRHPPEPSKKHLIEPKLTAAEVLVFSITESELSVASLYSEGQSVCSFENALWEQVEVSEIICIFWKV